MIKKMSIYTKLDKVMSNIKIQIYTLYFAYNDSRTPWYAKLFSICTVSYFLSPIDIIPDFIPVIGYLDDLIIIPIGIYLTFEMIPNNVLIDCKEKAKITNRQMEGKFWLGVTIVVINWIFMLLFTFYVIKLISG